MRIIILISIAIQAISCNRGSLFPAGVNDGLIAYFPFNGEVKNMVDSSVSIQVNQVAFVKDRNGIENGASVFNGINSSIVVESFSFPEMDSKKSVSWWYYSEALPHYRIDLGAENMIVLVDSLAGVGIQFGFRAPGYRTKGFDTWEWGGGTFMETIFPDFDAWHHCVYTYDGTEHKFYLDSKLVASSYVEPKSGNPTMLMFGNYPGGDQYFKGKMDEVRIYNRVLNTFEVRHLLDLE